MLCFSGRWRHTSLQGDWSSDVCSSDLLTRLMALNASQRNSMFREPAMVKRFCSARASWKIGRASCREGVEVSGARRSLRLEKVGADDECAYLVEERDVSRGVTGMDGGD